MGTGSSTSSGHPHATIAVQAHRNLMPPESRLAPEPYSEAQLPRLQRRYRGVRVFQTDDKTWLFTGVSEEDVRQATKQALRDRTPIDHGPLPEPFRTGVKLMVGAVTRNVFDDQRGEYGKQHVLGPEVYETMLVVRKTGDGVQVKRRTRGLLGAGAEIGGFGAAIATKLRRG
jgi:hypothetical protein